MLRTRPVEAAPSRAGARPATIGMSFRDALQAAIQTAIRQSPAAAFVPPRPHQPASIAPTAPQRSLVPAIMPSTPPGLSQQTSSAMAISDYPKPPGDNGRGIHWVPTIGSSNEVVDRFVNEATEMKMKWVTFLNEGTNIGTNDYLVKKLVAAGVEPVLRVYTPDGAPIQGNLEAMVRHYREMGVHYFQLYNEPNLINENQGAQPNVDRYLDLWLPAAKAVTAGGGLPGLGSLSPGGNMDDIEFFKKMLDGIKARGDVPVLDKAWVGVHNYTLNHPIDYKGDSNGFLKFQWYDSIVREKLGRSLPMIGTEGGTHEGTASDNRFPRVTEEMQVQMVLDAYKYMRQREPYNFVYTYWLIANEEGGGRDPGFSAHALFRPGYTSPLVDALKSLA